MIHAWHLATEIRLPVSHREVVHVLFPKTEQHAFPFAAITLSPGQSPEGKRLYKILFYEEPPKAFIPALKYEDFQPAKMSKEDFLVWLEYLGNGRNPPRAKELFPKRKDRYAVARLLRAFCFNKLAADYHYQLDHNSVTAMECSKLLETIYDKLPQELRWKL
jgi:hypothetical protein